MRLLRKNERRIVQDIDKAAVLSHVTTSVPADLVPSLFPERKKLWDSIKNTNELFSQNTSLTNIFYCTRITVRGGRSMQIYILPGLIQLEVTLANHNKLKLLIMNGPQY